MRVIICPELENRSVEVGIKSEGCEYFVTDMIFLVSAYFSLSQECDVLPASGFRGLIMRSYEMKLKLTFKYKNSSEVSQR